jgi:hypothetical protein
MNGLKDQKLMSPNVRAFITKFAAMAQAIADKYGLNPYVVLGQAGMESGWATSDVCLKAHNLFGIKSKANKPVYMDGEVAYQMFVSDSACFEEYGAMMTDSRKNDYYKALPWGSSIWHYADMLRELGYCPNAEYAGKVLGACKVFLDPDVAEIEEGLGEMERNAIIKPSTPTSRHESITREQLAVILMRFRYHKGAWLESVV